MRTNKACCLLLACLLVFSLLPLTAGAAEVPSVTASVESGGVLYAGQALTVTVTGAQSAALFLNDDPAVTPDGGGTYTFGADRLRTGANRLRVSMTDASGDVAERFLLFTVREVPAYTFRPDGAGALLEGDGLEGTMYGATTCKNINMYQNRLGLFGSEALRQSTEALVAFAERENIVTEAVNGCLPYQSFVVSVTGEAGTAAVSYRGETGNGDPILLKIYNHRENRWDTLGTVESGETGTFLAELLTCSEDGKLRVTAQPATPADGGDTLLWEEAESENRFETVNLGGYDFILLHLSDTGSATLAWADEVLRLYADRNAVLLLSGGDSETVWDSLVLPRPNVRAVLRRGDGTAAQLRTADGRAVLELTAKAGDTPSLRFTRGSQVILSDGQVYDLELIDTPLSIRTFDFTVGTGVFRFEDGEASYDALFASFDYNGRTFFTPILRQDNEEMLYAVPEDTNDYTEHSERYSSGWRANVMPSLRYGDEAAAPARGTYTNDLSLLPAEDGLTVEDGGTFVCTPEAGNAGGADLYFGVTANADVRWDITLQTASGNTVRFSQELAACFGFDVPEAPSGTWAGYIPMSDWLDADDTVVRVTFTAYGGTAVFDRLFLAQSAGSVYRFEAEGVVREVRAAAERVLYAPSDPSKPGYTFTGWADETGTLTEFPRIADGQGGAYTAVFTENPDPARAEELHEEVALAPITGSTRTQTTAEPDSGGAWYLLLLAIPLVLLLFAAKRRK